MSLAVFRLSILAGTWLAGAAMPRPLKVNSPFLDAGPAGFVSMEDGCVGGFVERGIATAENESAIVEMGGGGIESQATRATEASVRGFWSLWRQMTGL